MQLDPMRMIVINHVGIIAKESASMVMHASLVTRAIMIVMAKRSQIVMRAKIKIERSMGV